MPKTPRKQYFASEFPDICDTVSSCECTGLMPSPPTNDAERAAYETLFSMEVSQSRKKQTTTEDPLYRHGKRPQV